MAKLLQARKAAGLVAAFVLLGVAATAQASTEVAFKTAVLHPNASTTVTVRYADPEKAEPPEKDKSLPITITIKQPRTYGSPTRPAVTLTGVKGWQPWLFKSANAGDFAGSWGKAVFIRTACHYGGSGAYEYLAVVFRLRRADENYRVAVLPPIASESIHDGQFFTAKDERGYPAIVTTTPLMDNEARSDPTHWRVSGYAVDGHVLDGNLSKTATWQKSPPQKYSEFAPVAAIKSVLPRGWRLGSEIR